MLCLFFIINMDHLRHIWDRAPLLRWINPRSQWHSISPPPTGISIETNDGVFTNLSARPTTCQQPPPQDLPSYGDTMEDPVPPYWESQVQSAWGDEVYVDGLPVGSILSVIWTAIVSSMFQFVGFVVTYLLHTSHGSRAGSQIGLSVSLINLGLASLPVKSQSSVTKLSQWVPDKPSSIDFNPADFQGSWDTFKSSLGGNVTHEDVKPHSQILVAYCLIIGGGLITLRALWDFYRVKKLEWSVTHPANDPSLTPVNETIV